MSTPAPERRGIALLWVAILLVVIVGFVGLATDTAWMVLVNHQLQNAADSAALAGARLVRTNKSQARAAAQEFANANYAGTTNAGVPATVQLRLNDQSNDVNGDIVIGRYVRTTGVFTALPVGSQSIPNAVRVNASRTASSLGGTQSLFFGRAFGTSSSSATRRATAIVAGGLGAGLLVLDPTGSQALDLQGGPDLAVINGTIQVNSNSTTAVNMSGNYQVTGEELNIVGSMSNPPTTIPVNTGMPALPDPLAWLEQPSTQGMTPKTDTGGNSLTPGYYPAGIDVGGRTLTCAAGTYILGTPTTSNNTSIFKMSNNNGHLIAHGCTFFILGGQLQWTGGTVDIDPPPLDQGYYYEHITIFQARANSATMTITGNQNYHIAGTVYVPGPGANGGNGPTVQLNGTFGGSSGTGEGVQVIAYRVRLGGTANLRLDFDGWWPGPLTNRVYLVE